MQTSAFSAVRGDLLSCYTTSIAQYMQQVAIDYQFAIGTQLFLAVRSATDTYPYLSIVHQHTPLIGEQLTHTLALSLCHTTDWQSFMQSLEGQCEVYHAVIVIGDTYALPWLTSYQKKHAPHWFMITHRDQQTRCFYVNDCFEFTDETGTQHPFVGWIQDQQLEQCLRMTVVPTFLQQQRSQWALGTHIDTATIRNQEYQWFESTASRPNQIDGESLFFTLLVKTWRQHMGQEHCSHLPAAEWHCGLQGLQFMAEHLSGSRDDPRIYEMRDDIWVMARNRQLFAHVVDKMGKALKNEHLKEYAMWYEQFLIPSWQTLPRIMHYNMQCLQRKRTISSLLSSTLQQVLEQETEAMRRLQSILELTRFWRVEAEKEILESDRPCPSSDAIA